MSGCVGGGIDAEQLGAKQLGTDGIAIGAEHTCDEHAVGVAVANGTPGGKVMPDIGTACAIETGAAEAGGTETVFVICKAVAAGEPALTMPAEGSASG